MRNKLQKSLAKTTALTMAAALMMTSIAPANVVDAKAKGPKLSKKSISVVVKKTKKVKLKNTSLVKKTKWSIKNKKIAKLTKKKKTSIVIQGKKAGKTTVTAKVTLKGKKKAVKLKLKVQVVKNATTTQEPSKKVTSSPDTSPAASSKPGTSPVASNTPGAVSSDAPGGTSQPTPTASSNPDAPNTSDQPTAVPSTVAIQVPGNRTGIKQGETLTLTASGADSVSWSVTGATGATIDATGKLTVSRDAEAGTELTVTAQAAGDSTKKATTKLTIVENQTPVLTDRHIQLNRASEQNLTGLTFRSDKAYSTVTDAERGDVTRFDASQGYTSSSYDVLAWVTVDPAWAGKTVTISAYLKYDASEDIIGNMNLVINERWGYSNPAYKYNAEPDTWYHITGTYTLPEYRESRYNGDNNKLYITRDNDHMAAGKNAVYYIDDLVFSVEKADIENVTLTTESDQNEIYQNHDLQCSASVSGTGAPSQMVTYSIDPPVAGVTISDTGLLSVKNAAAGSEINVTATSVENTEKKDTKTITVLAQTIDTLTVTAEGSPEVIYQGNELQFTANVTATGDPSEEVTWSLVSPASGVTLTKNDKGALLKVGADAVDGTKLQIKATSVFDTAKSDIYEITVKANKIVDVTISSAGDRKTVSSELPLNLSVVVDNDGTTASKDVTWSITEGKVDGVSLSTESGNNTTLSVSDAVENGTSITVCATSDFDKTKQDTITVTVEKESSDTFNLNANRVEYWENFNQMSSESGLPDSGIVVITKDNVITDENDPDNWMKYLRAYKGTTNMFGLCELLNNQKNTSGMRGYLDGQDAYLQFALNNDNSQQKTYTLSFMFRFDEIAYDTDAVMWGDNVPDYELPLKLIAVDKSGDETVIKDGIKIKPPCDVYYMDNYEFYEIFATVDVPANETMRLQLKLDGELPECSVPDMDREYADKIHPVSYIIDNVAVFSSKSSTITLDAGQTYQLELETVEGDRVTYFTNSYLAQYTHSNKETTCDRFDTTVADVDSDGKVTANTAGETILTAEITHANGETERRQCIIHVN